MKTPSLPRLFHRPPPADGWLAGLLAALLLSADAMLVSHFHNFDGVACAIAIESDNLRHLAHGNHVLYGLVGYAFDAGLRLFGFEGRALLSLGLLNRLLHALNGALAFWWLRSMSLSRRGSFCGALGLSLSFGPWFYALEPHVYPLGLAGLLGASAFLFRRQPRTVAAGLCHGLAVGGHATHVLFLAPALFWLAKGADRKATLRYVAAFALSALAVYAVGAAAVRPSGWPELTSWLAGTATVGGDRGFRWHGPFDPLGAVAGFVGAIWAQKAQDGFYAHPDGLFPLHLTAVVAALAVGFASRPRMPRFVGAMAVWLGAYFAFFSTWEPANINYHLAAAAPLWALAAAALDGRANMGRLLLAVAAGAVALNNHQRGLARHASPESNPWHAKLAAVREATPEGAWIATADDIGKVYLPYFAGRRTVVLPAQLARLEALAPSEPVFALGHALDDPAAAARLRACCRLTEVASGPARLYRVERPARTP